LAFSLLAGAFFGLVLQRSRFCFQCNLRDFIQRRDSRGVLGIVTALAIGTIGYHVIFGAFLPVPALGRLPPGAHIGPVSWVLALGAFVFGLGMAISGSCISAHFYRLGEGSFGSLFALLGAGVGFALGFASWNPLYLATVQAAPVLWLPNFLGYSGSLLLQLAVLGLLATWLLKSHKTPAPDELATSALTSNEQSQPSTPGLYALVFGQRWPAYVGGILVGTLGAFAYFRVAPLGVTAELGSLARTTAASLSLLPARLEGLDTFAGCATVVKDALLSRNGVFVSGLVLASLASALSAGDFQFRQIRLANIARNLTGGILMGWGAMVALGCTVGTLLSGIMAGALSGWIFAVFCLAGVWVVTRRKMV
jgi:uncharacterized membrane protein YedE/YeeE